MMPPMAENVPAAIGIIAGQGVYPLEFAKSARAQGVQRLVAIAFKGETRPAIKDLVDEIHWLRVGQLQPFLDAFKVSGVQVGVMVGQITPTALFRIRPDKAMFELLSGLREKNAETIFGAVGDRLSAIGVKLAPASLFMEANMPAPGQLGRHLPTERIQRDIHLGCEVAKTTSGLDIGQTVVIKEGTILAVEAFEGTDQAIRRAGKLGGAGAVVVKVAKQGHDMRFDIPVVGEKTFKVLKKIKASCLAVEAGRCILLEREKLIRIADDLGIVFVAFTKEKVPDFQHES